MLAFSGDAPLKKGLVVNLNPRTHFENDLCHLSVSLCVRRTKCIVSFFFVLRVLGCRLLWGWGVFTTRISLPLYTTLSTSLFNTDSSAMILSTTLFNTAIFQQ